MEDQLNLEDLKKKKSKTPISITIDTDNLNYLREDMKKAGAEDIPLSAVFDMLLRNLVGHLKKKNKGELKKESDDNEKKK